MRSVYIANPDTNFDDVLKNISTKNVIKRAQSVKQNRSLTVLQFLLIGIYWDLF